MRAHRTADERNEIDISRWTLEATFRVRNATLGDCKLHFESMLVEPVRCVVAVKQLGTSQYPPTHCTVLAMRSVAVFGALVGSAVAIDNGRGVTVSNTTAYCLTSETEPSQYTSAALATAVFPSRSPHWDGAAGTSSALTSRSRS